jgi:hypothetical protein
MKSLCILAAACIFSVVSASGQTIGANAANGYPQMLTFGVDHPQHATSTHLAPEEDLLEHSSSTYAHGEKPLWEVMPAPAFTSLGNLAREAREEHAVAKKAVLVWSN